MEAIGILCPDCGGKGVDCGSLYEPEPCPTCYGAGELLPDELVGTTIYDYLNQAWVLDGVYMTCGHLEPDCGCYGKLHAGEYYSENIPRKPPTRVTLPPAMTAEGFAEREWRGYGD
jgi:hypothetical protein